jgi:hypothetical protein
MLHVCPLSFQRSTSGKIPNFLVLFYEEKGKEKEKWTGLCNSA